MADENLKSFLLQNLRDKILDEIVSVNIYSDITCEKEISNTELIIPLAMYLSLFPEREDLRAFLIKEVKDFSLNYFYKQEDKEKSYPNDLDDTCFGIQALYFSEVDIEEEYILSLLKIETDPGGPYNTWFLNFRENSEWRDIDPAVNSNLLYTLALLNIEIPNTRKYILECFEKNKLKSKYYPSSLSTLYYLSKYFAISKDEEIRACIQDELAGYKYGSLYEKIFISLIKAYLGDETDESCLKGLEEFCLKDSIVSIPFCLDHRTEIDQRYAGSKIITYLLILELLNVLDKQNNVEQREGYSFLEPQKKEIERIFKSLDCKNELLEIFDNSGSFKALTFPQLFANSLKEDICDKEARKIKNLSFGLYFGWMAYTLLDDYLDDEKEKKYLPVSYVLNQLHLEYTRKAFHSGEYTSYLESVMSCNMQYYKETVSMYFNLSSEEQISELKKLEPSYDYVLGRLQPFIFGMSNIPIILGLEDEYYEAILGSIMILDQLNDDLHDWEEDFENGILTYPVHLFLNQVEMKSLEDGLSDDCKLFFWEKIVPIVLDDCDREYSEAMSNLEILNNEFLRKVLKKSYSPILRARKEGESIKKIINYLR